MENSITQKLSQLRIIYLALIGGQLIFCAVVIFLNQSNEPTSDPFITYIAAFILLAMANVSFFLYNMRKKEGAKLSSIEEKVDHYRTSSLLRWALVEGGNLFLLVALMLEGSQIALILFVVGLLVFYVYRPSIEGFAKDYQLSRDEVIMMKK